MSIQVFLDLIPEFDRYDETAICRIECSARELRAMGEDVKRLRGELAELQNAFEDAVTAREKAEARAAAANDLLRECLDWGLPEDLKERIDDAIGEKK
jgi:hypothetical protein